MHICWLSVSSQTIKIPHYSSVVIPICVCLNLGYLLCLMFVHCDSLTNYNSIKASKSDRVGMNMIMCIFEFVLKALWIKHSTNTRQQTDRIKYRGRPRSRNLKCCWCYYCRYFGLPLLIHLYVAQWSSNVMPLCLFFLSCLKLIAETCQQRLWNICGHNYVA